MRASFKSALSTKKNARKLIKTKNKLSKQKANPWLKNKIE